MSLVVEDRRKQDLNVIPIDLAIFFFWNIFERVSLMRFIVSVLLCGVYDRPSCC